jgi:hypothetical protein
MATPQVERRHAARHYVGKATGLALRQRVYQTREAIEIDEVEGYDVTRRRVFYDDVLLVTHHQFVGRGFVIAASLLTLAFAALAWVVAQQDRTAGLFVGALSSLPFASALLLRVVLKVDAITVCGRRTKAQVHFWFRKRRARELFARICRAVKERQDKLARDLHAGDSRRLASPPPPTTAG